MVCWVWMQGNDSHVMDQMTEVADEATEMIDWRSKQWHWLLGCHMPYQRNQENFEK